MPSICARMCFDTSGSKGPHADAESQLWFWSNPRLLSDVSVFTIFILHYTDDTIHRFSHLEDCAVERPA